MRAIAIVSTIMLLTIVASSQERPASSETPLKWNQQTAHELRDDQTVRKSQLSAAEQSSLIDAIAAQLRPFKSELGVRTERELLKVAAHTRIELLDLNGDGKTEVIAQAFDSRTGCGATGNCPFWIFAQTPHGWHALLDSRDGAMGGYQLITVKHSRTGGFSDIVFATSESGGERTLDVYRFRDAKYHKSDCFVANWIDVEGGAFHARRKPDIRPCTQ